MTFQDLLALESGGQSMPTQQPTPFSQSPMASIYRFITNPGVGSLVSPSTSAPAQNNAAPAAAPQPSPLPPPAPTPVPMGGPAASAIPLPQPRPMGAPAGAPMNIAPPNPGPAMPNPSLQASMPGASPASASFGAPGGASIGGAPGGASNPSLVQSFVNSMRAGQLPQNAPPQGGQQGQGILPKGMNDISQLMKLFGGGAGGNLAAGAGASSASPLMLSALF